MRTANEGVTQSKGPCKNGEEDYNPDINCNSLGNTFDKLSKQNQERKFDRKSCRPSKGRKTNNDKRNRAKAFDVLRGEYVCTVSSHGFHKKKLASVVQRDAGGTGKSYNSKEYKVIIKAKSTGAYANDGSCRDSQNGYSKRPSNKDLCWWSLAPD